MTKKKILLQLDTDSQASSFDAVVAIDSGVEQLLQHDSVSVENVQGLVHGAMFTRGPDDLKSTALFFGGSNVERTQEVAEQARSCFFQNVRVSTMSDPNGSNTTAAAAVLCAQKHIDLKGTKTLVLGGTGPVGLRIAQLVVQQGGLVELASRTMKRASEACQFLKYLTEADDTQIRPVELPTRDATLQAVQSCHVLFAAGAAGVCFLEEGWESSPELKIAIDLNAVPPSGIEGIGMMDKAKQVGDVICYGAIGVGGFKMKLHKLCLQKLFESNDLDLDTTSIYEMGTSL